MGTAGYTNISVVFLYSFSASDNKKKHAEHTLGGGIIKHIYYTHNVRDVVGVLSPFSHWSVCRVCLDGAVVFGVPWLCTTS